MELLLLPIRHGLIVLHVLLLRGRICGRIHAGRVSRCLKLLRVHGRWRLPLLGLLLLRRKGFGLLLQCICVQFLRWFWLRRFGWCWLLLLRATE